MDQFTLDLIKTAHPSIREELTKDYIEVNNKLPKYVRLRFTSVHRTDKEQTDLYAQGRTKPGRIITNAKAWQSIHNYGGAFDFVILHDLDKNGTFEYASYDEDKYFKLVVAEFKKRGWEWAGDWKSFKEKVHFQKRYKYQDLINLPRFLDNGRWYPKIDMK